MPDKDFVIAIITHFLFSNLEGDAMKGPQLI